MNEVGDVTGFCAAIDAETCAGYAAVDVISFCVAVETSVTDVAAFCTLLLAVIECGIVFCVAVIAVVVIATGD